MTVLVQELKTAMDAAGVIQIHSSSRPVQEPLAIWDEIVNELVPGGPNDEVEEPETTDASGPIQIENQIISLPSNGNVGPEYSSLELSHRISHADQHRSTQLKLSWIWQHAGGHRWGLASVDAGAGPESNVIECKFTFILF